MKSPVFIQIADVRETLHLVDDMKQLLIDARRVLTEIHSLRAEENKEIFYIKNNLQETISRVSEIDGVVSVK